jgi:tetratricopeptide (TPR) repeat protein
VWPALEALLVALQLDDRLWRGHYYIGRIHRDHGESRAAAERFTRALALHASEASPYIALCELYRGWQYRDEAMAIGELGARVVPGSSDVWFELGMAHDERGNAAKAIEAFTRALDLRPDNAQAQFQRGQTYFRKHDVAHATADLEAFIEHASSAGGFGFESLQAAKMLASMKR